MKLLHPLLHHQQSVVLFSRRLVESKPFIVDSRKYAIASKRSKLFSATFLGKSCSKRQFL